MNGTVEYSSELRTSYETKLFGGEGIGLCIGATVFGEAIKVSLGTIGTNSSPLNITYLEYIVRVDIDLERAKIIIKKEILENHKLSILSTISLLSNQIELTIPVFFKDNMRAKWGYDICELRR